MGTAIYTIGQAIAFNVVLPIFYVVLKIKGM